MRVATHFALWSVGLSRAETQTSEDERRFLAESARGRKRLVEIGVWHGVTTARLRAAMDPAGVLFAVDPFPPGRLGFSMQAVIAHHEVKRARGGTVEWVRLPSVEAASRILSSGPVDFVFIDGDHSYDGLASDWKAWSDAVGEGGLIALHDSISSKTREIEDAGSVRFTRERISHDPRFARVGGVDTVTLWRRRA
jgi:predicted O-methyltransferase YrrM